MSQSAAVETPAARRPAPWPVVAAFYLWWSLIVAQSIGLVWMGFTFEQAARIGGPAWDILFVFVPIGLPTFVLATIEIVSVIRLRKGSRAARIWLAVLAIPAAVSVLAMSAEVAQSMLFAAASVTFVSPAPLSRDGVWAFVILVLAIVIAAAVLPFTRPVGRFFWKPPHTLPATSSTTVSPTSLAVE